MTEIPAGQPTKHLSRKAEYKYLTRLEQATTYLRYTTFTALIGISFLLPGFASRVDVGGARIVLLGQPATVPSLAFLLGFIFYLFSLIHYTWYHRYAHRYRARLKELELELGISVYLLRKRPSIGRMKFHFDWVLYILGVAYGYITGSFVGWLLTSYVIGSSCLLYLLLMVWSIVWDEEPLESDLVRH